MMDADEMRMIAAVLFGVLLGAAVAAALIIFMGVTPWIVTTGLECSVR